MKQAEQEKNNDPSHWLRIKRDNISFDLHNNSLREQRQELLSFSQVSCSRSMRPAGAQPGP